jgi:hypothetical protein
VAVTTTRIVLLPLEAVSVCPSCAVPEIAGRAVFDGGTPVATAEAFDVALAEPTMFVAVTTTRKVEPSSLACTV